MRTEGFLNAERALAQHSERLARRAPEPDQLAAMLAALAPRLEQALAGELAALLGGDRPRVTCGKVELVAAPRLHKMIEPVAVNWLFEEAGGSQVLVSLALPGALAVTDMVFGGPGMAPTVLPERLPKSTDLALAKMADSLGAALGKALEHAEAMPLAMRSDVLGKLVRARDDESFLALSCGVAQDGASPVDLVLVVRLSHAPRLLAEGGAPAPAMAPSPSYSAMSEPFAGVPLSVVAVLADLTLPVRRISALKPGDLIPIAVGRDLPLRLQGREIARGQAGSSDGLLALRITSTGWTNKDPHNG